MKDCKFVIHALNWSKGWCLSCRWSLGGESSPLFFIWQSLIKPFWFLWARVAQTSPPRTHPQQLHASLTPLKRFQLLCLADLTSNESIWSVSEKYHRLPRLSIQRRRHRKPFQARQLIRNIHPKQTPRTQGNVSKTQGGPWSCCQADGGDGPWEITLAWRYSPNAQKIKYFGCIPSERHASTTATL